jgi:hypothetical protein
MGNIEGYHLHTSWRSECVERFGLQRKLPIVRVARDMRIAFSNAGDNVLDFGCGQTSVIKAALDVPEDQYYSLDRDGVGHDFSDIKDIPDELRFGLIVFNQVIEHIPVSACMDLFEEIHSLLSEDGVVVITVPNTCHPVRYWADIDHITPWSHADIFAILKTTGYLIEKMGRYNKFRLPLNPFKRYIVHVLSDVYRIDWCDSLFVLGRKVSNRTG